MDKVAESPFLNKKRSISTREVSSPRTLGKNDKNRSAVERRGNAQSSTSHQAKPRNDDSIFVYEDDDADKTELDHEQSVAFSAPAHTSPVMEKHKRDEALKRARSEKEDCRTPRERMVSSSSVSPSRVERVDDFERARSMTLSRFNFMERLEATKRQVDQEIVQLLQGAYLLSPVS